MVLGRTSSCHWQIGTFDVLRCWNGSGWDDPILINPPGGDAPPPDSTPPPSCEITGISDENPDQPILSIQANDAVVEMTLYYDGAQNQTVARTDSIALQPLNYFRDGHTAVTVQCRNAAGVYAAAVMNVERAGDVYERRDNVYGVWTEIGIGDEPVQGHGEWSRYVTLLAAITTYDAPIVGIRNGMYEHRDAEDHLTPVGDTPRPAWDSALFSSVYSGGEARAWGWPCPYSSLADAICFDNINKFVRADAPNARAVITDLNVPLQGVLFVSLLAGKEVSVGPQ